MIITMAWAQRSVLHAHRSLITQMAQTIQERISINKLFETHVESLGEKRGRLVGIIGFWTGHFVTTWRSGTAQEWILLNDALVSLYASSFAELMWKISDQGLAPVILFYATKPVEGRRPERQADADMPTADRPDMGPPTLPPDGGGQRGNIEARPNGDPTQGPQHGNQPPNDSRGGQSGKARQTAKEDAKTPATDPPAVPRDQRTRKTRPRKKNTEKRA